MPIDPDVAIGAELPDRSFSWTSSDVLLYHLGIGFGSRPGDNLDPATLSYTNDGKELQVLPSFGVVVPTFHGRTSATPRTPARWGSRSPSWRSDRLHGRLTSRRGGGPTGKADGLVNRWSAPSPRPCSTASLVDATTGRSSSSSWSASRSPIEGSAPAPRPAPRL